MMALIHCQRTKLTIMNGRMPRLLLEPGPGNLLFFSLPLWQRPLDMREGCEYCVLSMIVTLQYLSSWGAPHSSHRSCRDASELLWLISSYLGRKSAVGRAGCDLLYWAQKAGWFWVVEYNYQVFWLVNSWHTWHPEEGPTLETQLCSLADSTLLASWTPLVFQGFWRFWTTGQSQSRRGTELFLSSSL